MGNNTLKPQETLSVDLNNYLSTLGKLEAKYLLRTHQVTEDVKHLINAYAPPEFANAFFNEISKASPIPHPQRSEGE